ncbi:hypothetical protein NC797_11535 [Aquibacillus sp. 3ASR75-11]|uniref:Uncharacterized protein n=1 Tax=Terrihalobacillus insolitus TaxID=2950438 RepID=A0A9X4AM85_9BACI|nr:hypothetical protein [Terrihalobacillus insolitus]MDC3425137.1 hypothetical protein [Terrihalobacillus insolitus]
MKKRSIILVSIIVIGIGTWLFINDQMKYTTYGTVISDMVNQEEAITEISIESTRKDNMFRTNNKQIINKIVNEPSQMELKKQNKIPTVDYMITINTDTYKDYLIMLGKNHIQIGTKGQYKIVKNNNLYQLIENADFDWKPEN